MSTSAASVVAARSVPAGRGWEWIVESWKLTAGYRVLFVGLVVAFLALAMVSSLVPLVGSLAAGLFVPVIQGGLIRGCDAMRRGEGLKIDHLFAGFERHLGKLVLLGAVQVAAGLALVVIGGAIVGFGTLASMTSGVPPQPEQLMELAVRFLLALLVMLALSVPLFMLWWFAVPLIALRGAGVGAAMSASFAGCLKNVVPFLVWSVAVLALGIVPFLPFILGVALRAMPVLIFSMLPLMLGCLAIAALFFLSMYTSYEDVFATETPHG
jgi:hypothetical protein